MTTSGEKFFADVSRLAMERVDPRSDEFPLTVKAVLGGLVSRYRTRRPRLPAQVHESTEGLLAELRAQARAARSGSADPAHVASLVSEIVTALDLEGLNVVAEIPSEAASAEAPATVDTGAPRTRRPRQPTPAELPVRQQEKLIREHWLEIVEQMTLARARVELQREILLELLARAAQRPDFALSREWARDYPEVFPRDRSWDQDWYVGDEPIHPARTDPPPIAGTPRARPGGGGSPAAEVPAPTRASEPLRA